MINSFLLMLSLLTCAITIRTLYRIGESEVECHDVITFLMKVIIVMCVVYALLTTHWIYDGDYAKIGTLKDIAWNLFEMIGFLSVLRFLSLVENCPMRAAAMAEETDGCISDYVLSTEKAEVVPERIGKAYLN